MKKLLAVLIVALFCFVSTGFAAPAKNAGKKPQVVMVMPI